MDPPMNEVRILCVDDQRTFRDALNIAIDSQPDLTCVGVTASVGEAIEFVEQKDIDVVIMDFDLPDVDGIEGTRRVKAVKPDVRVIILTGLADLDTFVRAVAAGADGFLAKDTPIETLLSEMRNGRQGLQLDNDTLNRLRTRIGDNAMIGTRSWSPNLTDREKEVLALLAAGLDPQAIARQLGIRIHTCRGYVRNILIKLGAHSQLEAVAIATQANLLTRT
jgi:DNA-binding NarL/FixJ family response regulator